LASSEYKAGMLARTIGGSGQRQIYKEKGNKY
jgi:hypothetical protein